MKFQELTIANFVKSTKKTLKVSIVSEFDIVCSDGIIRKQIQPILVTIDWLLKFGFKADGVWFEKLDFAIDFNSKRCVNEVKGNYNQLPFPKYVHELQNLYFVMTKKELTLK